MKKNGKVRDSKSAKNSMKRVIRRNKDIFDRLAES